jgi:ElaB/YqjD/DUF883 family membrane-anchored ribosome-binding protein
MFTKNDGVKNSVALYNQWHCVYVVDLGDVAVTDNDNAQKPKITPPNIDIDLDKAKETVTQVTTDAARSAAEARRAMRETAYTVKEAASDSLLTAAESIRREAVKSGSEDVVHQAHQLARNMEKAALYLDGHTFEQISQDATEVVRANPWQSVGVVFIVGLVVGALFGGNKD